MSVWVEVTYCNTLDVPVSRDKVWTLLADVETSSLCLKDIDVVTRVSEKPEVWTYRFKPIGFDRFSLVALQRSEFTIEKDKMKITWRGLEDKDVNVIQSGTWDISGDDKSAKAVLEIKAKVEAPVPKLMAPLAKKTIPTLFKSNVDTYMANISAKLLG